MKQRNFKEIYDEIYQNCGEELEKQRKKTLMEMFFLIISFVLISMIVLSFRLSTSLPLFVCMIAVIFIVLIFSIAKLNKKYKINFKEKVINEIVKKSNSSYRYIYNKGVPSFEYAKSGFDSGWDRYSSEDLIEGELEDGSKLKMSQVHTQQRYQDVDANGHTEVRYVTTFLRIIWND